MAKWKPSVKRRAVRCPVCGWQSRPTMVYGAVLAKPCPACGRQGLETATGAEPQEAEE